MSGKIQAISGPTVSVDLKGLKLYERVYVGHVMLTGEVVRLEQERAVIQVYEDTRGLAVGEPVKGAGMPLTVRLGAGLLSGMFDGLQRPLGRLKEDMGPFIRGGKELYALDYIRRWKFTPLLKKGDEVTFGSPVGFVDEGPFKHYYFCRSEGGGRIARIADGDMSLDEPLGEYEDGQYITGCQEWPVRTARPYRKKLAPSKPLITGQRSIDFLFPLARGGTAIFPGGFGTGKTILEQSIAKFADVDVVVYAGCGERGNEMADLIAEFEELTDPWTKRQLMERTILVANTSNMPVAAREASIYTAVTMAEYYRDMGYHVLFLADSLSRWAEALREISSSLEEMPGEEGYPTYLASRLSGFLERAGVVETMSGKIGSLTMILSVSPPGGDFTEPVTQACLRTTGAFLMLDTSLAHRRHFPAINWFQSYSLYGRDIAGHYRETVAPEWEQLQQRCKEILQEEESLREVSEIVGAEGLQDTDRLLMIVAEMIRTEFLSQNAYSEDAFSPPEKTLGIIKRILGFYDRAREKLNPGTSLEEVLQTERSDDQRREEA
ncbi:MAG TPA: V-type ATP synthase subunit A [Thermodesulfovibrionales bacterium]|nr:V-type ATP synthase subunit A [Thermodesulfovibrionales bacterium]